MSIKQIISAFLITFVALSAKGQILTDGISGKDQVERLQFIQTFSSESDTCMVMTDSLGRFEIDPYLMDRMRGNVYLKPMNVKPKPKIKIDSPFDSIDVHRKGRARYLTQCHIVEPESEEPVFYYDPETTLLKESVVKAKRNAIARDKVTGYLDSLAILASGEWVCDCGASPAKGYLNDYRGYSHHPEGYYPPPPHEVKHLMPKRGETYRIIKYKPGDNGLRWYIDMDNPPQDIVYNGPQYTEEELLEINGMIKVQGYYHKREFYEPDALDLANPTPDFRNQLLWQSSVLTDENGRAEIPFAASDVNTEFIGIVESIDGMGLIGGQTFTFRVVKQ